MKNLTTHIWKALDFYAKRNDWHIPTNDLHKAAKIVAVAVAKYNADLDANHQALDEEERDTGLPLAR